MRRWARNDPRQYEDLAEAWSQIGFTHLSAAALAQRGSGKVDSGTLDSALDALTRSVKIKDDDAQTRLWKAQSLAMLLLKRPRHPQRHQPQDAARLLKARQPLPFALEHRQSGTQAALHARH